jgi:hypothetical protein
MTRLTEQVDDEHPESTKSIALANKHIYSTSRLVSHRRKTLDFDQLDDIEVLSTKWLENPTALRGIRHITISSSPTTQQFNQVVDNDDGESWTIFVNFIKQAARLRTITWRCCSHIPLTVIEALEKYHPSLQLKVYNYTRPSPSGDSRHPAELALARSPLLVGISAKLYCDYTFYRRDFREVALRRIIATAPNLKYASVLVDQAERAGHRATKKEDRDAFYSGCSPNPALRTLVLDGYRLSKSTLEDWSNFVDLSALENIKCLRGGEPSSDYFAHALKVLPSLKHVSLNLRFNHSKEFRAAVENYLLLCPTLESLSLWSWMGRVKLDTILRHGPTLKMLQLHEREEGMLGRPTMTVEDVKAIREACPQLTDLTIDMRRESRNLAAETRNDEICRELALFGPQLEKVQVYFDLGIASIWAGLFIQNLGDEDSSSEEESEESDVDEMQAFPGNMHESEEEDDKAPVAPEPVTFKIIKPSKTRHIERYVAGMWQMIFGQKMTGLRALDIKFGEWEQKIGVGAGGHPGHNRSLETGLKSFWMVRPCVRDDMRNECTIERRTLSGS